MPEFRQFYINNNNNNNYYYYYIFELRNDGIEVLLKNGQCY